MASAFLFFFLFSSPLSFLIPPFPTPHPPTPRLSVLLKEAINKRIHSSGPKMTCSWKIQLQAQAQIHSKADINRSQGKDVG